MGVVKTEYGLCYTADTCFNQYSDFEDCGLYVGDTGKIFISQAKKIKNVYHLIYECSNLIRAQYKAQQGKGERTEISKFNENILENLDSLYWDLRNETYTPGEYRIKVIYEPKERVIMIAPFFPDRKQIRQVYSAGAVIPTTFQLIPTQVLTHLFITP